MVETFTFGGVRVTTDAQVVEDGFHARFSATGKRYRYVYRDAPARSRTRYCIWSREWR